MSGVGRGGTGVLKVDGNIVATQKVDRTIPIVVTVDETFDVGSDTGTSVEDQDYQVPFKFTGKIDKLTITLEPPTLTLEDVKELEAGKRAAQDAN